MSDDSPEALDNDDDLESRYANYFRIGYNEFEFVFDFGEFRGGVAGPRWHSRTITAPFYMKVLAQLLATSVGRYEAVHGRIRDLAGTD
jgi:hypothetical protein